MYESLPENPEAAEEEIALLIKSTEEILWTGLDQWIDGFEWEVSHGF